MKKSLLIASLFSIFGLVACSGGESYTTPSSTTPSSSVSPSSSVADSSVVEDSSVDDGETEDSSSAESTTYTYSATVLKPDSTPATSAMVTWCSDTNCFRPIAVDENGTATYNSTLETLYVHLQNYGDEYAYNPNAYVETKDRLSVTITLSDLLSMTDNTITSVGVYSVALEANTAVEITLDLTAGDYNVESWADYTAASAAPDFDPSITFGETSDDNSGEGNNFSLDVAVTDTSNKISITANSSATLTFVVTAKA